MLGRRCVKLCQPRGLGVLYHMAHLPSVCVLCSCSQPGTLNPLGKRSLIEDLELILSQGSRGQVGLRKGRLTECPLITGPQGHPAAPHIPPVVGGSSPEAAPTFNLAVLPFLPFLSNSCMPGLVLGTGDLEVNKTSTCFSLAVPKMQKLKKKSKGH